MKEARNLGFGSLLMISVRPNSTASPWTSLNNATKVFISSKALAGGSAARARESYKLVICYLFLMANAMLAVSTTFISISFSLGRIRFLSLISNSHKKYFLIFGLCSMRQPAHSNLSPF